MSPFQRYAIRCEPSRLCLSNTHAKVDENMQRAQKRDAARSGKFYFRKDVYPHDRSVTSSVASSHSGCSSPTNGSTHKQKKLGNCFTPPGPPINGELRVPIEEEYEEMTMDEIMNGKVRPLVKLLYLVWANSSSGGELPRSPPPGLCVP